MCGVKCTGVCVVWELTRETKPVQVVTRVWWCHVAVGACVAPCVGCVCVCVCVMECKGGIGAVWGSESVMCVCVKG